MLLEPQAPYVLSHPGEFALRILKGFRANQGLLLAGSVAYYALLSIVPLLILIAIALSHVIDPTALLESLGRYIGWLAPGQGEFIVGELANFLRHREVMGWVLLVTMLFFSSLASNCAWPLGALSSDMTLTARPPRSLAADRMGHQPERRNAADLAGVRCSPFH